MFVSSIRQAIAGQSMIQRLRGRFLAWCIDEQKAETARLAKLRDDL
jgi:hypothetical protein